VVSGKVRKYYTITPTGLAALEEARRKIRELVSEVLEGVGPTRLPDTEEALSRAESAAGRPRARGFQRRGGRR